MPGSFGCLLYVKLHDVLPKVDKFKLKSKIIRNFNEAEKRGTIGHKTQEIARGRTTGGNGPPKFYKWHVSNDKIKIIQCFLAYE